MSTIHPGRPVMMVDRDQMLAGVDDAQTGGLVQVVENRLGSTRRLSVVRRRSARDRVWWWDLQHPDNPSVTLRVSIQHISAAAEPDVFVYEDTRTVAISTDSSNGRILLADPLTTTLSGVLQAALTEFSLNFKI